MKRALQGYSYFVGGVSGLFSYRYVGGIIMVARMLVGQYKETCLLPVPICAGKEATVCQGKGISIIESGH